MKSNLFFCACVVFLFATCKKEKHKQAEETIPQAAQSADSPNLPATPYDYINANLPDHIALYLAAHPEADNTPLDNPITNAGATLGRVLYYDKALSANNKISCSSCHFQKHAFSDTVAFSTGFHGGNTKRNAMPTFNNRYFKAKKMFWDMRAASLEAQTLMPITDAIEMGMPDLAALEDKLKTISYYPDLFKKAFGTPEITSDKVSKALAQFIRSISSFKSKYDQNVANNFTGFTASEINGKNLVKMFACLECHSDHASLTQPQQGNFTFIVGDDSGQNTDPSIGSNNALDLSYTDQGIGALTGLGIDMGTFKMPTLRNVELTAPYMHDGRFKTLEEVLDHYSGGVKNHPNKGIQLPPGGYNFNSQQKADIIAFLKTLTDKSVTSDIKYSSPFKN